MSDANTNQKDLDGDGVGDVCDFDRDGDDIENADDLRPDLHDDDVIDIESCLSAVPGQ